MISVFMTYQAGQDLALAKYLVKIRVKTYWEGLGLLRISGSYIYQFSANNPAVARAASGSLIVFETQDCFSGQITNSSQTISGIDFNQINPATGPVFIEDAEPGDVLAVAIKSIKVAGHAVTVAVPGLGLLPDLAVKPLTKIVPLEQFGAAFSTQLNLTLRPMIGVIGVAPSNEAVACGVPGPHGGNLDTKDIREGATLLLPVHVTGGLLALGDVHALQGDGEVCGTGLECAAEVEVVVNVLKGRSLSRPMLLYGETAAIIGIGEDLHGAAQDATEQLVDMLAQEHEISKEEAYMLCSAHADLRICQVVNPRMTVRAEVPLFLLPSFGHAKNS